MIQIVQIALENEMDLALAYRKSMRVAQLLGMSLSSQTSFATAISEVGREIIDKTHEGVVFVNVLKEKERYHLQGHVTFLEAENMGSLHDGLEYAKKLVPHFSFERVSSKGDIKLKIAIPSSAKLNDVKITGIKSYFEEVEMLTPYEKLRKQNQELFLIKERSETALRESESLNNLKNEFFSIASHELKNPLTILRAFTQLALKGECNPTTISYLKKVDQQANKIHNMIQQLLDSSKIENRQADYNMELTDAYSFFTEVLEAANHLVPLHQLEINLQSSKPVNIDRLRIEQVITNIISNAAKYSAEGTKITVTAKENANFLEVFVKDEGIGISKPELKKIFDKFYRVENVIKKYNGLGMGLYIASKIITDHGGSINAESTESNGSTFSFTLPLK